MLSRLNFCVNSQTPHASKNKRHKPYFFTHVVTVALSSSIILTDRKLHWALAIKMTKKTLIEANILCNLTFKVFQKHTFFRVKHLRPPSPKRPVAESAAPNCPRPRESGPEFNRGSWCDHITYLAWPRLSLEPAELPEVAVDGISSHPRAVQRKSVYENGFIDRLAPGFLSVSINRKLLILTGV